MGERGEKAVAVGHGLSGNRERGDYGGLRVCLLRMVGRLVGC